MKVELLDKRVVLSDEALVCECIYSGEEVGLGDLVIAFYADHWDPERGESKGNVLPVSVSAEYSSEFRQTLLDFEGRASRIGSNITPSGSVKYDRVSSNDKACIFCTDHVPDGSEAVSFEENGVIGESTKIWCHLDCIPDLCGVVKRIEESDTIVSQTI